MAATLQVLSMVAGSTQPSLSLNVSNVVGNTAYDLTGYVVQLDIKRGANDVLTKTATIDSPTTGVAVFEWAETDLPDEGQFDAQLVLTSPDGGVWKVPGFIFQVVPSLR